VTRPAARRVALLAALAVALTACGTLSVEEEKELGAKYQTQLRKELTFVRDPVSVLYIRQFGAQLAGAARPSPFEFRFYLVENEEINAFAIPGGAMYVNTGLLMAVKNGAELASVLSHEMGHVTARHVAKMANTERNTGFVANIFYLAVAILTGNPYIANAGGLGASVAGQAFISTFTRDAEREADALAVETMVNAGWNPNGMVSMFETLKNEGGGGGGMPQFLSSHPATDERIQNTRNEIQKYPDSDKLRLVDPKLPIIQERLKLIVGTDREKSDESTGDDDKKSDDKKSDDDKSNDKSKQDDGK
jgi:predicted Zn-dependent protease